MSDIWTKLLVHIVRRRPTYQFVHRDSLQEISECTVDVLQVCTKVSADIVPWFRGRNLVSVVIKSSIANLLALCFPHSLDSDSHKFYFFKVVTRFVNRSWSLVLQNTMIFSLLSRIPVCGGLCEGEARVPIETSLLRNRASPEYHYWRPIDDDFKSFKLYGGQFSGFRFCDICLCSGYFGGYGLGLRWGGSSRTSRLFLQTC
mmetsp:Transcript_41582/g.163473  ORF Transcript_41582/g.163473 Transcript_41582/m.163473 type:complete len:202 (+) Transcript_41582:428-1033(+)